MKDLTRNFIFQNLETIEDVSNLSLDLENVKQSLYTKKPLFQVLHSDITLLSQYILEEALGKEEIDKSRLEAVKFTLEEIEKLLKETQVVTITLPINALGEVIAVISKKIKEILFENAVLEVKADESLIGGITIAYKGRYKNYSILPFIQTYLEKEKLPS